MRRREFIAALGGAVAAPSMLWPHAARAQPAERIRRIGWLIVGPENDSGWQANVRALREALARLGWIEDRNLRTDLRFAANDPDRIPTVRRKYASGNMCCPDRAVDFACVGSKTVASAGI